MLVLQTAVKLRHKTYRCSPLNVVEKPGFDAVSNPDRLRMIGNGSALNEYEWVPRFVMEGLNKGWHIFREGDVLLFYDESNGFWHAE